MTAKKIGLFAACLALSLVAHAETIVYWGEPGGMSGNVGNNWTPSILTTTTTYVDGTLVSPGDGLTQYYPNGSEGRTLEFNGASTLGGGSGVDRVFNAGGTQNLDTIVMGTKASTDRSKYESMICWEKDHFLQPNTRLTKLHAQIRFNEAANMTGSFRWIIKKSDGSWYASEAIEAISGETQVYNVDPSKVTWYDFTPFVSGVASVGTEIKKIDMNNLASVGVFNSVLPASGSSTLPGYTWAGVRYFKAEADVQRTVSLVLLH